MEKKDQIEDGVYISIMKLEGTDAKPLTLRKIDPNEGMIIVHPKMLGVFSDAVAAIATYTQMLHVELMKDYEADLGKKTLMAIAAEIKEIVEEKLLALYRWERTYESIILTSKEEQDLDTQTKTVFTVCYGTETSRFIPFCCASNTVMSNKFAEGLQAFAVEQLAIKAKEKGISEEELLKIVEKTREFYFDEKPEENGEPLTNILNKEMPDKTYGPIPPFKEEAIDFSSDKPHAFHEALEAIPNKLKETPDLSSEEQTPSSQYVEDTMDS